MVSLGSAAKREVEDMHLSRYACYLVVQSADPTKETTCGGQQIKTRVKKTLHTSSSEMNGM